MITYEQSAFSAYGVYMLAMKKLGYPCDHLQKIEKVYHPQMEETKRMEYLDGWKKAIDMVVYDAKGR